MRPNMHLLQFSRLPEHLQLSIIEKCDFKELYNFMLASKIAKKLCANLRSNIPINVTSFTFFGPYENNEYRLQILKDRGTCIYDGSPFDEQMLNSFKDHIRFETEGLYVPGTSEMMKTVEDWITKISIKSEAVWIQDQEVTCSPDEFSRVFQMCGAKKVSFFPRDFDKISFFRLPCLQNIDSINLHWPINEAELMEIHAKTIHVEGPFSAEGINEYFKEWLCYERDFEFVNMRHSHPGKEDPSFDPFEELSTELIWTYDPVANQQMPELPVHFDDCSNPWARIHKISRGNQDLYVLLDTFRIELRVHVKE